MNSIEINFVCFCAFSLFSLGSSAGLEGELCRTQCDLYLNWESFTTWNGRTESAFPFPFFS